MGALVKPGCLLNTYAASGKNLSRANLLVQCRRGYRYTRERLVRNAEISQPVPPAKYPSPRELRYSGRQVKTEFTLVFKSLSTDQGVLVDERIFPNNSPVYMDSPNRIRGHPGHLLVRNRFFRKFLRSSDPTFPSR